MVCRVKLDRLVLMDDLDQGDQLGCQAIRVTLDMVSLVTREILASLETPDCLVCLGRRANVDLQDEHLYHH